MMKKTFHTLIFFLCCIIFNIQDADALQKLTAPVWQEGQTWLVKVSYPDFSRKDEWSSPVVWRYTVVGESGVGAERLLIVEVSREGENASQAAATLTVHATDMSPKEVETTKMRRGKPLSTTVKYEEKRPLITQTSMVPIDLPIFPLQLGERNGYPVTQELAGDLMRKREIIVDTTESRIPESERAKSDTSAYFKVTVAFDDGDILFTQYWKEGKPWPSFGMNGSMKYWLVDDEK